MENRFFLVTNNSKAVDDYGGRPGLGIEYLDGGSYLDVLICARDHIHRGCHLLSHPQASNLKPNQCPYKTILMTRGQAVQSFESDEELIESSISAYHKFTKGMLPPQWSQRALDDFKTVDLAVIESALVGPLNSGIQWYRI